MIFLGSIFIFKDYSGNIATMKFCHKTFFAAYNALQLTLLNLKIIDLYELNKIQHNIKVK